MVDISYWRTVASFPVSCQHNQKQIGQNHTGAICCFFLTLPTFLIQYLAKKNLIPSLVNIFPFNPISCQHIFVVFFLLIFYFINSILCQHFFYPIPCQYFSFNPIISCQHILNPIPCQHKTKLVLNFWRFLLSILISQEHMFVDERNFHLRCWNGFSFAQFWYFIKLKRRAAHLPSSYSSLKKESPTFLCDFHLLSFLLFKYNISSNFKNIARGTTDPGFDSISWVNISARIVQDWFQYHYLNCRQWSHLN